MTLIERFMAKVMPEPNTGCWIWYAGCDSRGYGNFKVNRKIEKAHRTSYTIHVAPIPIGKHVLHRCDNRYCVNPNHLWLGDNTDNVNDKVMKGRQARGEKIHGVISAYDVLAIRASDLHNRLLSSRFNISLRTVQFIKARKTWSHI